MFSKAWNFLSQSEKKYFRTKYSNKRWLFNFKWFNQHFLWYKNCNNSIEHQVNNLQEIYGLMGEDVDELEQTFSKLTKIIEVHSKKEEINAEFNDLHDLDYFKRKYTVVFTSHRNHYRVLLYWSTIYAEIPMKNYYSDSEIRSAIKTVQEKTQEYINTVQERISDSYIGL